MALPLGHDTIANFPEKIYTIPLFSFILFLSVMLKTSNFYNASNTPRRIKIFLIFTFHFYIL